MGVIINPYRYVAAAAGSAVERTGTVYTLTAETTTHSVSVPADADIAVAFRQRYSDPPHSFTLGGESFTAIAAAGGGPLLDVAYLINPPTGTQDFVVSEATASNYPGGLIFWKNVDTTTPIKDYATVNSGTAGLSGLTATADDMMVGAVIGFYEDPDVSGNSQTVLIDVADRGFAVAEKQGATSFTWATADEGAIAIILANG